MLDIQIAANAYCLICMTLTSLAIAIVPNALKGSFV